MTVLLGVDCATQPAKTGIALGELRGDKVVITRCGVGTRSTPTATTILEWLDGCDEVLFAFDSPLGWPVSLGRALHQHSAGDPIPFASNALFRRAADEEICRRLGKLPLEVGASWLARTAVAALSLLDELRRASGRPIPLAWQPREAEAWRIIEVYPAATRIAHGAADEGGGTHGLSHVLDCSAVVDILPSSKDAADACVCALAAADFLAGHAVAPDEVETAHREAFL